MLRPIARIKTYFSILAIVCFAAPVQAQSVTAEQVDVAIKRAQSYFRDQQLPDGGWPEYASYPGGVSALVTLALLNSGLNDDSPTVSRALKYVAGLAPEKTYSVALQTMTLCAANPNRYAATIESNARWLIEAQQQNGGWSYDQNQNNTHDPSNSQFALLALHEAQRAGIQLPPGAWKSTFTLAGEYWKALQNKDGSFPYSSGGQGRGSMTCAGIASLVIAGSQVDEMEASVGQDITCCGQADSNTTRIAAATAWLARNFQIRMNPNLNSPNYHLYYIYGLERAGRLTGQRFIGDHDWYREGSEELLRMQDEIGKITPNGRNFQGNEYSETAFSLLFLAKGKRQIVVSRLKFGNDTDWNRHGSAIQHLTAFTEQAWKRDLAWQVVDIRQSTVTDLLESPVLYITGTNAPNFSNREKEQLREYVEQGGFIYAEACHGNGCNGRAFENYFKDLVVELFDQPLEKLTPEHPIWSAEAKVAPSDLPRDAWLYGVQTCCRLGVVYCPISLGCRWELDIPYGQKPSYPEAVQKELDTSMKVGLNVLAYATGRELKQKLETVTVLEDVVQETPTDRGLFVLPVLRHNAGADDAPRAVPNLIQWLDKENPFQMSSEKRLVNIRSSELEQYPVVFMHGRGTLRLSDQQRDALRDYLNNGGFLFADAICADQAFADSFREEMQLITGQAFEQLSPNHPMLTNAFNGFNVQQVEIISPNQSGEGLASNRQRVTPRFEIMRNEGLISVVFSPLDISCALESRHSLQCQGYIREDAARLGINVILFALQQF